MDRTAKVNLCKGVLIKNKGTKDETREEVSSPGIRYVKGSYRRHYQDLKRIEKGV
jgi:hypothetical protein